MTQNINIIPNDPQLADLLTYWGKQLKLEINCHHIGTIETFNPLTQTAQVSINYTKTFLENDSVGSTSIVTQDYALILDCPCIVMGGGGGYLSFPISSGDECLVCFNDRDMDNWFAGSSSSAPASGRLHAFTDALAIVGVRSMGNVIASYSDDSVVLNYLDNQIEITEDSITASLEAGPSIEINAEGQVQINNDAGELLSTLQNLFTDIQSATTNTVFGPQPLIMPTFATHLAILESFVG